jgi:CRP-like cAMP-binding protein
MNQDSSDHPPLAGPSIAAPALWTYGDNSVHPLTAEERALVEVISTVVRFKKGQEIYREGDHASAVFNIITGVAKSYKTLPNERQYIAGFLFAGDLLGLAQNGKYVNSAAAVTNLSMYRMPTAALEVRLRRHAGLDFQVIAKLCHDLRETQRHAVFLAKQHAIAKVGLFLQMLETSHSGQEQGTEEVYLPMTRSDIGAYAGISPEAVSRSFRELVGRGVISFRDRRHIKIIDRAQLEAAIMETDASAAKLHATVEN